LIVIIHSHLFCFTGNTPLHLAALTNAPVDLIDRLVAAGADPLINNESGDLPHDLAQQMSQIQKKLWTLSTQQAKSSTALLTYLQRNYLINALSQRNLQRAVAPLEEAPIIQEEEETKVQLSAEDETSALQLPTAINKLHSASRSSSSTSIGEDTVVTLDSTTDFLNGKQQQKAWATMNYAQRFVAIWPILWAMATSVWENYRMSIYISLIVGMFALGAIEFLPYFFSVGRVSQGVPLEDTRVIGLIVRFGLLLFLLGKCAKCTFVSAC